MISWSAVTRCKGGGGDGEAAGKCGNRGDGVHTFLLEVA